MGFKRVIEDFKCVNCGEVVQGTGYTNHCPVCLYSLHVDDKFPGDRASSCKGLMQPQEILLQKGEKVIVHKCVKCGKIMKNKLSDNDNFEEVLKHISKAPLN